MALLILPLLAAGMAGNAWVRIVDVALLYVLLALGLNIVVGYAGLLDLGYVAFYAVGAYMYGPARLAAADRHLPGHRQRRSRTACTSPLVVVIPLGACARRRRSACCSARRR